MIHDRPEMMTYRTAAGTEMHVSLSDEMVRYAIARFSGRGLLNKVRWNTEPPGDDSGAEGSAASHDAEGWIRMKYPAREEPAGDPSPNKVFEEYWSALIYQFFTMENQPESQRLYDAATALAIDRETFILQQAALAHRALRKSNRFYKERWLPWAGAHQFVSNPEIWRARTPSSFAEWLRWFENTGFPEQPFGTYYDDTTAWARQRVNRPATTQFVRPTP
jgi:hypothetical protein